MIEDDPDDYHSGRRAEGSQHPYARFGNMSVSASQSPSSSRYNSNRVGTSIYSQEGSVGRYPASPPASAISYTSTNSSHRGFPLGRSADSSNDPPARPPTSEGPSFASSSSAYLPGALGINDNLHSNPSRTGLPAAARNGVRGGNSISPFGGFHDASRGPPPFHHQTALSLSVSPFSGDNRNAAHPDSDTSGSSRASGLYSMSASGSNSSLSTASPSSSMGYGYGIGGPSAGSGTGALGFTATSTSRDFLVPIGATGARQKLSILSPSQRRMGSASTTSVESNASNRNRPGDYQSTPGVTSMYRPAASAYVTTRSSEQQAATPRGDSSLPDHGANTGNPKSDESPSSRMAQQTALDAQQRARPTASTPPRPLRSISRNVSSPTSSTSNASIHPSDSTSSLASLSADASTAGDGPSVTAPLRTAKNRPSATEPPTRSLPPTPQGSTPEQRQRSKQRPQREREASAESSPTQSRVAPPPQRPPPHASLPSSDALPDLSRAPTPTQASVIASQWRRGSSGKEESSAGHGDRLMDHAGRDRRMGNSSVDYGASANDANTSVAQHAPGSSSDSRQHSASLRQAQPRSVGKSNTVDASNFSPSLNQSTDWTTADAGPLASAVDVSGLDSSSSSSDYGTGPVRREGIKGKFNKILGSAAKDRSGSGGGSADSSDASSSRLNAMKAPSDYGKEKDFSETSLATRYRDAVNRGELGMTTSRSAGELSQSSARSDQASAQPRRPRRMDPVDVSSSSVSASSQGTPSVAGRPSGDSPLIKRQAEPSDRVGQSPAVSAVVRDAAELPSAQNGRYAGGVASRRGSEQSQTIQHPLRRPPARVGDAALPHKSSATGEDLGVSSVSHDSSVAQRSTNLPSTESHSRGSPEMRLKLGDWGDDLHSLLPSYLQGSTASEQSGLGLDEHLLGGPAFEGSGGSHGTEANSAIGSSSVGLPARSQQETSTSKSSVPADTSAAVRSLPPVNAASLAVNPVPSLADSVKPRSPPRPLPPQPDTFTLGRLNGPSQTQPLALPTSKTAAVTQEATKQQALLDNNGVKSFGGVVAKEAQDTAPRGIDPKTYVPKGALTHNRKGTAVTGRPSNTNTTAAQLADRLFPSEPLPEDDLFGMSDDEEDFVVPLDSGTTLPSSAWAEVENALSTFRGQTDVPVDKGVVIRNILLPFLALEAETPNLEVTDGKFRSAKARRALFFDWIAHLLIELQHVQTSADRGAILESIACIIESRNLSASALDNDSKDEAKFSSTFGHILLYAIGELNKKGVYQNTLIFSGRLLAIAFFRVDGVASKLLRALPINRFAMERVAAEAQWAQRAPKNYKAFVGRFPVSLRDFCFQDARSYLRALDAQSTAGDELDTDRYLVRQPEVEVEMTGNWLRRWQSDDSELFFSFCRSYHRQLAGLLMSTRALQGVSKRFFGGPGYAHLATCIHLKCLSLVNRVILSVTTLSSQKNFNPGETANVLSGSTAGKPRHLEAANRRCTAIIVDIVRAPSGNNQTFLPMLGTHIKCLVKRTSLYDVQSVFCLLDWLDGVLGHMDAVELPIESLVDIDFLIEMIGLLLAHADHALALMRTIAFCYSNFAVLIGTVEHRKKFCEKILLDRKVFHKLFLSWSFTIRAYFLHLLVFRLARLKDFTNPEGDAEGKSSVEIAKLFNQRLDEIRKRHEELSPVSSSSSDKDDGENGGTGGGDDGKSQDGDASSTYSRIKSSRTSFVSTIRHTPSIHQAEPPTTMTKAERVLGIGMPDPFLLSAKASEPKAQSRAAKWLRALGGKGASKNKAGTNGSHNVDSAYLTPPPMLDSPNISNRPRFKRKPFASDLDFDDDDDEDDDDENDNEGNEAVADDGMPYEGGANGTKGKPAARTRTVKKESEYEFDFENRRQQSDGASNAPPPSAHHDDHITPDATFDLQSPQSPTTASSTFGAPPSRNSASPQISRALSRRTSILPGPAAELVEGDAQPDGARAATAVKASAATAATEGGYPESLHIYATQGLREWEAVLAEHDDFFATMADQSGPPAVPRLPVQWPAMWSD